MTADILLASMFSVVAHGSKGQLVSILPQPFNYPKMKLDKFTFKSSSVPKHVKPYPLWVILSAPVPNSMST
jgi:hypothetical protein